MQLLDLSNCVLCLQLLLLLVLERAVSHIHAHLKSRAAVAATAASANGAQDKKPAGARPTVDSLGPEVINPSYAARKEWGLLQPDELQVVRSMKRWFGPEFGTLPIDVLVCFVRGYAYRSDWAEASFAYLDRCLRWRREMSADGIAVQPELVPPKRAEFEAIVQAGGWVTNGPRKLSLASSRTRLTSWS